jgi:hypothetical protein
LRMVANDSSNRWPFNEPFFDEARGDVNESGLIRT